MESDQEGSHIPSQTVELLTYRLYGIDELKRRFHTEEFHFAESHFSAQLSQHNPDGRRYDRRIPEAVDVLTMENLHKRKKQPELVRRTLLDCAAQLAADEGLSAVTIQAVSDAAGVTKGGLMHHFPTKQALVEGMTADLLEKLDAEIDALMASAPHKFGCFTRAYLNAGFADHAGQTSTSKVWSALSVTSITDPRLREMWANWLDERLERHRETDQAPILQIVRLAADGVWLNNMLNSTRRWAQELAALQPQLVAMTQEP